MSDLAIRVDNLGKMYRIGRKRERRRTLRDTLAKGVAASAERVRGVLRGEAFYRADADPTIWALKGLSLEIKQGELVGIVGRNGAGKSTLLKILSRITDPTEGYADVYGRVGSLLEVGTGFHFELTGRENIYLNGAILGMKRSEIDRKFDEIVAFSEVEQFIDTPVKHYSSGMYLRLAFAVAAHLEPEILLVDEVLAVGDAAFQKKCLGKMGEVGQEGRTVLFVSHNMSAITALCERCIWLEGGQVAQIGPAPEVVRDYLKGSDVCLAERLWSYPGTAPGDAIVRLLRVAAVDEAGAVAPLADVRRPLDLTIEYQVLVPSSINAMVTLANEAGIDILTSADNHDPEWAGVQRQPGLYRTTCRLPGNFLAEGRHSVTVSLTDPTLRRKRAHCYQRQVVSFDVYDPMDGSSAKGLQTGARWSGVVRPMLEWSSDPIAGSSD